MLLIMRNLPQTYPHEMLESVGESQAGLEHVGELSDVQVSLCQPDSDDIPWPRKMGAKVFYS